jgi:hypothetical protein
MLRNTVAALVTTTVRPVTRGSTASCWAGGHYWDNAAQTDRNIALHWTGTSWSTG